MTAKGPHPRGALDAYTRDIRPGITLERLEQADLFRVGAFAVHWPASTADMRYTLLSDSL